MSEREGGIKVSIAVDGWTDSGWMLCLSVFVCLCMYLRAK